MKTTITSLCTALLLATVCSTLADENKQTKPASPEFERMKTLVGSWTGKTDMGQGPVDITLQYRLLAGGSVLEERVFAGTPQEMVTMYYDQNGKLAMTHYCVMGNRPGMKLKSSAPIRGAVSVSTNPDTFCATSAAKPVFSGVLMVTG